MKFLIYALLLLAVLIVCVIVLQSIDKGPSPAIRDASEIGGQGRAPVVQSTPPSETELGLGDFEGSTADELYAAGVELLSLWHVREATALIERATAADSTLYTAWAKLVECYSHPLVAREDDALAALQTARSVRLSDADTTFLLGLEQFYIARDYAAASAMFERATRAEVSHDDASYYLAKALLMSGRIDEARREVDELVKRDATDGRFTELSVRCAMAADDLGAAAETARELARMYADEPYPYVMLALVERASGRPESAVEFCNNALVIDSKYLPAILARANLYAAGRHFEAARVSFEKLLMFDDPALRSLGHEGIGFVDLLDGRFNPGIDEMDEAIRAGMLAGSVRYGLSTAVRLIGYLCELGQGDAASGVVERWVTGFGDIPVKLARLRIDILEGDLEAANGSLRELRSSQEWAEWAGMMSVDYTEMLALAHIGAEEYDAALGILSQGPGAGAAGPGTRKFLAGYALFQSGRAEDAVVAFEEVGRRLYGVEFPYHGGPVKYVRSLFYLGETNIAAGRESEAAANYERFLDYWGKADWDVQAVARAHEKIESLATTNSTN